MNRAIVTGSHGFIGKNLVRELKKDGYEVDEYDIKIGKPTDLCIPHIKDANVVFHLSCLTQMACVDHPHKSLRVNVLSANRIAEECVKRGTRMIYTSSASVYGNQKPPFRESDVPAPISQYAIDKLSAEHHILRHGADAAILRLSNVYGPGQDPHENPYAGVIGKMFTSAHENGYMPVILPGRQSRDFTYIDDVVDILVAFSHNNVVGTVNVATGVETSVNKLADEIGYITGCNEIVLEQPRVIDKIDRRYLDVTLLKSCGYSCETLLAEGLTRTYNYFHEIRRPNREVRTRAIASGSQEQRGPQG